MIKDTDASALFLNIASEIKKKRKKKTVFHRCLFGHLNLNLGLNLATYKDTPAFFPL